MTARPLQFLWLASNKSLAGKGLHDKMSVLTKANPYNVDAYAQRFVEHKDL